MAAAGESGESSIMKTIETEDPETFQYIKEQSSPTILKLNPEDPIIVGGEVARETVKVPSSSLKIFDTSDSLFHGCQYRYSYFRVGMDEGVSSRVKMMSCIHPIYQKILEELHGKVVIAGGCPMKLAILSALKNEDGRAARREAKFPFSSKRGIGDVDIFIIDPDETAETIATAIEGIFKTYCKKETYIVSNYGKVISFDFLLARSGFRYKNIALMSWKPGYIPDRDIQDFPSTQIIKGEATSAEEVISRFDFAPAQIAIDKDFVYISTAAVKALKTRWFPFSPHSYGMNIYKRLQKYSQLFKIIFPCLPISEIEKYVKSVPALGKTKLHPAGGGLAGIKHAITITSYYDGVGDYEAERDTDSGEEEAAAGASLRDADQRSAAAAAGAPVPAPPNSRFMLFSISSAGYGGSFGSPFDPSLELSPDNAEKFFTTNLYSRLAFTVADSAFAKLDRNAVIHFVAKKFMDIKATDKILFNPEIAEFYAKVGEEYRRGMTEEESLPTKFDNMKVAVGKFITPLIDRKLPINIAAFSRRSITLEEFYRNLLSSKKTVAK